MQKSKFFYFVKIYKMTKITLFFLILSQILARNPSEQILFAIIFSLAFFFISFSEVKKFQKEQEKRRKFLI